VTIAIIGRGRVGGDCVDADDVDDDADDVDDGDVVSTAADDCGFVGTVVVVGTFVVGSGRSNQSQSEEPVVVVGVIAAAVTAELAGWLLLVRDNCPKCRINNTLLIFKCSFL
jgi:hypothetical protein